MHLLLSWGCAKVKSQVSPGPAPGEPHSHPHLPLESRAGSWELGAGGGGEGGFRLRIQLLLGVGELVITSALVKSKPFSSMETEVWWVLMSKAQSNQRREEGLNPEDTVRRTSRKKRSTNSKES